MAKEFEPVLELPGAGEEKTDRQFVTALARGLEVLRAFNPDDGPLGNQDLAERTGLPKPTVSRITHTLTKLGYLDYVPRLSRYRIGAAVLSLGHACVTNAGIRDAARPHMLDLAEFAEASVAMGVRDRLNMIYLEVVRGSQTVAFTLDVGARIPLYRTAMGAAYLSGIPAKERDFLLNAIAAASPKEWPTISDRLDRAWAEMRDDGFCVLEGTYERAMNSVGTVLTQADGSIHAFTCSAPAFQFSGAQLRKYIGPRLIAMRDGIRTSIRRHGMV